jgi:hypothetical protein
MMTVEPSVQPASILRHFIPIEANIRVEQLGIENVAASVLADVSADFGVVHSLMHRSALILEVMAVTACLAEAIEEHPTQIWSVAKKLCGLEPTRVIEEAQKTFGTFQATQDVMPTSSMFDVVRVARAVLEACPIEVIERLSGLLKSPFGHRCRSAFETVKSFLLRQGARELEQLKLIGYTYAQGNLTVQEVATLLETDTSDAMDLLERHGFSRSLGTISLTPEERAKRISQMREERLKRDGKVAFDSARAVRDALASERLEGIDARPWIQH